MDELLKAAGEGDPAAQTYLARCYQTGQGVKQDDGEAVKWFRRAAEQNGVAISDLPSYAGHDAGILAARVPAAMLFVRNPTGASHTPAESASESDCLAGAQVLTDALAMALAAE